MKTWDSFSTPLTHSPPPQLTAQLEQTAPAPKQSLHTLEASGRSSTADFQRESSSSETPRATVRPQAGLGTQSRRDGLGSACRDGWLSGPMGTAHKNVCSSSDQNRVSEKPNISTKQNSCFWPVALTTRSDLLGRDQGMRSHASSFLFRHQHSASLSRAKATNIL